METVSGTIDTSGAGAVLITLTAKLLQNNSAGDLLEILAHTAISEISKHVRRLPKTFDYCLKITEDLAGWLTRLGLRSPTAHYNTSGCGKK